MLKVSASDLVLYGHDGVVLGGVDVQDVVVVLPAQVVGDVGEGGAGRLGHAVVDDDEVVLVLGRRRGRRVPFPQAVLRVPLLDLSHLMSGDGSLWRGRKEVFLFTLILQTRRKVSSLYELQPDPGVLLWS